MKIPDRVGCLYLLFVFTIVFLIKNAIEDVAGYRLTLFTMIPCVIILAIAAAIKNKKEETGAKNLPTKFKLLEILSWIGLGVLVIFIVTHWDSYCVLWSIC